MPEAPESMCLMNFTWPGTSTTPTRVPEGRSRKVKPSSMVRPRCFSSLRRSQSTPVMALIREVLPWSTCPAVPMTILFMVMVKSDSRPRVNFPSPSGSNFFLWKAGGQGYKAG